jgi:hypothetical protein
MLGTVHHSSFVFVRVMHRLFPLFHPGPLLPKASFSLYFHDFHTLHWDYVQWDGAWLSLVGRVAAVKLPWPICIRYAGTHLQGSQEAIKTRVSTNGALNQPLFERGNTWMQVKCYEHNAETTCTMLDNTLYFHSNFAIKWGSVSEYIIFRADLYFLTRWIPQVSSHEYVWKNARPD